jgi:hypothetical protein
LEFSDFSGFPIFVGFFEFFSEVLMAYPIGIPISPQGLSGRPSWPIL